MTVITSCAYLKEFSKMCISELILHSEKACYGPHTHTYTHPSKIIPVDN